MIISGCSFYEDTGEQVSCDCEPAWAKEQQMEVHLHRMLKLTGYNINESCIDIIKNRANFTTGYCYLSNLNPHELNYCVKDGIRGYKCAPVHLG